MILLKTIRSRHFRALLKLHSPSNRLKNPPLSSPISSNSSQFLLHFSISSRPFSLSAQFAKNSEEKIEKFTEPLSVFYKKAFRAAEKSDVEAADDSENAELKGKLRNSEEEVGSLKEKLRNLEEEVRRLSKKMPKKGKKLKLSTEKDDSIGRKGDRGSLWALFADKKKEKVKVVDRTEFGNEDPTVHKELSPDMQTFARHLYELGYFKDANFIPRNKFDLTCFELSYAREFLKFAVVNFGKDHQEIAKWLSAKDLKKVASFGCPSLGQRTVYAAKHMRRFFEIEEQKVCQKCTLKKLCDHANKRSKKDSTKLYLPSVTRVLTMYALESVPQRLVVPEEIKDSVSRLLKEIVSLTQNTS